MQKISVLFVIHFKEVWTSLHDVYRLMTKDDRYVATIAAINFSMLGEPLSNGLKIAEMLGNAGVEFVDLTTSNEGEIDQFLNQLSPTYVFRQTPWEGSFPEPFKTPALLDRGIKILYIPYNMHIVDHPEVTINQYYISQSSIYFCFCEEHMYDYTSKSVVSGSNAILTGSPKLDHIALMNQTLASRDNKERPFCIVWSPHHSISANWLSFGSFYNDLDFVLDFAKCNPSFHIIFRPHPLLRQMTEAAIPDSVKNYDAFMEEWESLENTFIDQEPDCAVAFANSDCLITDGISFLVEYQVTGKPLIFIDNAPDAPLTPVGTRAKSGATVIQSMSDALKLAAQLRTSPQLPPQSKKLDFDWLRPFPGQAAARIVEAIHSNFVSGDDPRRRESI